MIQIFSNISWDLSSKMCIFGNSEAATRSVPWKKMFLNISQISQENSSVGVC